MKRAILSAALVASAFMGAMTVAHAEDAQMRVKIGDLNLATTEGAQAALSRIEAGANAFCDVGNSRQPLNRVAVEARCAADMTRKGVDGLNAPLVNALLESRGAPARPQAEVALAQK